MLRRKKRKTRFETDAAFREYLEECWPEHFRRVSEARRAAPFVRFYYPLLGFLFSTVLSGGLTLGIAVAARQDYLWGGETNARGQAVRAFLEQAVPVLWVASLLVVIVTVVACVAAGLARARAMQFEAEKLEMSARTEHALWIFRVKNEGGQPFETLTPGAPESHVPAPVPRSDLDVEIPT